MNNELGRNYFENAIEGLVNTYGIAEPVDAEHLIKLAKSKQYEKCLREIVKHYNLPIHFKIKIVPRGYVKNISYFKTGGLVKTDVNGRGKESITAQVSIPANVPLFGDPKLKDLNVDIVIGEECSDHPETFIFIVAHEVSHLLLETLRHPEKHNEIYADLLPLTLGFAEIANSGRTVSKVDHNYNPVTSNTTTTTNTTTYGYMSSDQFDYSVEKVNEILNNYRLEKRRLAQKFNKIALSTKKLEALLVTFTKLLSDIETKAKNKINPKDALLLVKYHDIGYLDAAYGRVVKAAQHLIDRRKASLAKVKHYNKNYIDQLYAFDESANLVLSNLEKATTKAKSDVEVLKRNFKPTYRFKLFVNRI